MKYVANKTAGCKGDVEFFLEEKSGGEVILHAKNYEREIWDILRVNPDGTVYRYMNLPPTLGFPVDSSGRVVKA